MGDTTDPFTELMKSLRAQGLESPAREIQFLMETAWTTGTEMLGQLGLAVLRIRKKHRKHLSPESKQLLKACLKDVHRAWPLMGREHWIWITMLVLFGLMAGAYWWFVL